MESGDYQGVSGRESEGSEDGIYEQESGESGQESWAFF